MTNYINGQNCYDCGASTLNTISIPPEIVFPEKDEFEIDFKSSSFSVPSCEVHSLNNSDLLYFAKMIKAVESNNVFANFRDRETVDYKTPFNFSTANYNVETHKIVDCISKIGKSIIYHELKEQYSGKLVSLVLGFRESHWPQTSILTRGFFYFKDEYVKKGKYPQVFFYQLVPANKMLSRLQSRKDHPINGLLLRISFYEGAEFFLHFEV